MLGGLPSLTAMAVCAARGLSEAREPMASSLLPPPFGALVRGAARLPLMSRRVSTAGLVDHVALRTAAIDDAIATAAGAGTRQVVILGAGLDARAWRMDALVGSSVLEVDHPSTQAWKVRRAARLGPAKARVRMVPVDFAHDALADALARADHDASAPTTWVWEGVTPYLAREAVEVTLAVIAARSAPGSVVAMTYATPELTPLRRLLPERLVTTSFRALGEPLRSTWAPADVRGLAARHGLGVARDEGPNEWAARFPRRGTPWLFFGERLATLALPAVSSVA